MSARAKLKFTVKMGGNHHNFQKVWAPLNLGDPQNKKQALDRLIVLDMIRQVYDPILTEFLTVPGNVWIKQFFHGGGRRMQRKLRSLQFYMPPAVQSIENDNLGLYLFDVLRCYRFTSSIWRVPLPPPAPEVVGPPHPEAPRVIPFTAINANWAITKPAKPARYDPYTGAPI